MQSPKVKARKIVSTHTIRTLQPIADPVGLETLITAAFTEERERYAQVADAMSVAARDFAERCSDERIANMFRERASIIADVAIAIRKHR